MNFCLSFNTPFGWLTLEATQKGLKRIRFGKFCTSSKDSELLQSIKNKILHYLRGEKLDTIHEPLDTNFTPSGEKIFNALIKVPYGTTITYKDLSILAKTSPRACGRVLGSNPLPIIIPCHRVIRSDGTLGGYSGGLRWKKILLKLEAKK
jgi:O-6-methylguanine DNA methyltransferase